jgi:medium-chain acyl-[acyl-carrier-protein] hydrolase
MHEASQMRFLVPIPRTTAAARLMCFPHAGGAASAYLPWARALADRPIEIAAAQLPGRGDAAGDPPCADLHRIVDGLADAIEPLSDRPFAFFGHSLGGLLAFELARCLRDRGDAGPAHLFVSGAFAPQIPGETAPLRFIDGDTAFLEAVAAKYGGVPKIVLEQADLRRALVPALRADLALTETYTYRPAPRLTCPITAYAGASDPIVSAERLAAWRDQTTGEFTFRLFPGHHFYLNRQREALIADITRRLFGVVEVP